ncbi:protein Wnt-4-like [Schistocerca gregaria]|uniref:protein Wnt-4-like n=1 Tax=Schistocerca gregaria TaxID=7010 RepID=UPI00211EC2D8|nr:protein Wnt-4-like [Schistocerca gregaria]
MSKRYDLENSKDLEAVHRLLLDDEVSIEDEDDLAETDSETEDILETRSVGSDTDHEFDEEENNEAHETDEHYYFGKDGTKWRKVPWKAAQKRRSATARTVRAMLSGRQQQVDAAPATPAAPAAPAARGRCPWPAPPATRRQASLCRREPALPAVLLEARGRALDGCRAAFRFDRWNCSLAVAGQSVFAKQFRETAALQAVSGAALADAVSRACARGQLRRCGCPATADSRRLLRESGACPEGAVAAAEPADARETVLRHNLAVGMQVVEEQLEETCRCHGVSGSCAAKTCWRRLAPFPRTADALRRRYLSARLLLVQNSHRDLRRAHRTLGWSGRQLQLLYLDETPPLCSWTRGRRCSDADNCAMLCCGRGFHTIRRPLAHKCRCHWLHERLLCDWCRHSRTSYFCE